MNSIRDRFSATGIIANKTWHGIHQTSCRDLARSEISSRVWLALFPVRLEIENHSKRGPYKIGWNNE